MDQMNPSFLAFTDELFLIKAAEEQSPSKCDAFKHRLKQLAVVSAGTGLGTVAGEVIAHQLPPDFLDRLPPIVQKHLPMIFGAIGMGSTIAGSEILKRWLPRRPVAGRPPEETNESVSNH